MTRRRTLPTITAILMSVNGFAGSAWAASLSVANNGIDSNACGLPSTPCRTISQAIENAQPGDTIWVGAGHYGDVSGNGSFSGAADEHPQPMVSDAGFTGCIVCVNKRVKVYSNSGAAVTTIDSGASPGMFNVTVAITADGACFGSPGHGFTVTGGNAIGVGVDLSNWTYSRFGINVAGNRDLKDGAGFQVMGPRGCDGNGCICPPGAQCPPVGWYGVIDINTNESVGNGTGTGFSVSPKFAFGYGKPAPLAFLLRDNVASAAGIGFGVAPGASQCDGCLNGSTAHEVSVIHNAASGNGEGFALFLAGPTLDNLATDNASIGFDVTEDGSAQLFKRNSAIGNGGPGVMFSVLGLEPIVLDSFTQNSFFANDRNRPPLPTFPPVQPDPGPSAHCGVLNVGAVAGYSWGEQPFNAFPPYAAVTLQAQGNYWGSKQGPQAHGPGDTFGGACDQNNATTIALPFSMSPANVIPVP